MGFAQSRLRRTGILVAVLSLGLISSLGPARSALDSSAAMPAGHALAASDRSSAAGLGSRLYVADGSRGFAGWTTKDKTLLKGSDWNIAGGQLIGSGAQGVWARAPYEPGASKITDYAIVAQIRMLSIDKALAAPHGFGMRVRGQGLEQNYGYQASLQADQTPSPQLFALGGVSTGQLAGKQFVQFDPLAWHTYREEVLGTQIRYLIDGVVVLKGENSAWKTGGWVGLVASGAQIAVRSFAVWTLAGLSQGHTPTCSPHCGAGAVLYQADWSQGARSLLDWSAPLGDPKSWDLSGGMLLTDGGSGGLVRPDFAPGDFGVADYAVEAQIKLQGVAKIPAPSYTLRLRGQGIENHYGYDASLTAPTGGAAQAALYNAGQSWLGGKRFVVFDPMIWHTYRVEVSGKHLEHLIDGVPVAVGSDTAWTSGGFAGIGFAGTKIAVRSFRIISVSGKALPAAPPCDPHCGSGGAQYALPPSSFSAHNLLDWTLVSGSVTSWQLANGTLVGSKGDGSLIKPDYEPGLWQRADYAVQAEIQVQSLPQGGSPNYGVIARGQGIEMNYGYQATLQFNGKDWDAAMHSRGGGYLGGKKAFASFALGSWHTIRLEVRGTQIRMLVDGTEAATATDKGWSYGGWAAVYYSGPQIAIRSFTIQ